MNLPGLKARLGIVMVLDDLSDLLARELRRKLSSFEEKRDVAMLRKVLNRTPPFAALTDRQIAEARQLFDFAFYRQIYPGCPKKRLRALAEFLTEPEVSGRDPGPLFDSAWYRRTVGDVALGGLPPLLHYVASGWAEGRNPHPLFEGERYLDRNLDIRAAGLNPLLHYLLWGGREGRDPHPLFEGDWYLERNGDVRESGMNPLVHYLLHGANEGRDPHPLFDSDWYLFRNLDVQAAGVNPLRHYLCNGGFEGRDPHPLFDSDWYLAQYPDVAASGVNPLVHYLSFGASEGRNPNPFFDTAWYLRTYPDVAATGVNPLVHYQEYGGFEGRQPSPRFDSAWYLRTYEDVAGAGLNPLYHFLSSGQSEGRRPFAEADPINAAVAGYRRHGEWTGAAVMAIQQDAPAVGDAFKPFCPLNVVASSALGTAPALNILFPSLQMRHATGGPNTAYLLAMLLAKAGVPIRLLSTDLPPENDLQPIKNHIRKLTGLDPDNFDVEFVDVSDRSRTVELGAGDIFMATAWWTAQMAKCATAYFRNRQFVYLIQDYETSFYGGSERYVLAEATYDFDHIPVINTSLLLDHLVANRIGRYLEQEFAGTALVFEPAIDRTHFYPPETVTKPKRTLMFYARPTLAARNLFSLGVSALRSAVDAGVFGDEWEFIGVGEQFAPVPLGHGHMLKPAPWMVFADYAAKMRETDIMLSLMISPHPSYPPLEAAAAGGIAVTTVFGSKTASRLHDISENIIGVPPTVEGLVLGLAAARLNCASPARLSAAQSIRFPSTWQESLAGVVTQLVDRLEQVGVAGSHTRTGKRVARAPVATASAPPLLSIITTVYDTHPDYLRELAASILSTRELEFGFEWLILDNGSSAADTRVALNEIAEDTRVRLARIEANAGIIGGQRWCLDNARGRYVLPVDSDDILYPGTLDTMGRALVFNGFPKIAYSDEEKCDEKGPRDEYRKPDWDPVLFIHSCYIAHLTAIDRETAVELGCYSDKATEGCHDWDTFTRFMTAGYVPFHIPRTLYTWRMHPGSTAGNYKSKPIIYSSHRAVLERFLASRQRLDDYEITLAPAFGGTPDYRFAQRAGGRSLERSVPTLRFRKSSPVASLLTWVAKLPEGVEFVRFVDENVVPEGDLWAEEAVVLMNLFPDTVMVGGRIHDGARILETGYLFDETGIAGCPDAGRPLADPGYFAQAWKPHTVDALSLSHTIVRRSFIESALENCPDDVDLGLFGFWLGAAAAIDGRRVVYSPYVEARAGKSYVSLTDARRQRFAEILAGLACQPTSWTATWRRGLTPDRVAPVRPVDELPTYAELHDKRLAGTTGMPSAHRSPAPIAILTTVYERTDTALFEEAVRSVRAQSVLPAEWLVLAHGPIPEKLGAILRRLDEEHVLTFLELPVNLGIHGGLRYCLERATSPYCVCLDADDLLADDAVEALGAAIGADPESRIFYSDEDLLIDGAVRHPFFRPDRDPVLTFAHSFIWHAICFNRELAVELGAFTSAATQYAQDWDILVRFALAGHPARHEPKILYHWRQHRQSLSNSGTQFDGSTRSVRAVLDMIRSNQSRPDNYEIAPYPFDLGAPDFYLRRRAVDAPDVLAVTLPGPSGQPGLGHFPFRSVTTMTGEGTTGSIAALTKVVQESDCEYVLLVAKAIASIDTEGLWQAIKQMELSSHVVAVSGPVLALSGEVIFGCPVYVDRERLVDPLAGRRFGDGLDFSIGMKPHCIAVVSPDLAVVRRGFLLRALEAAPVYLDVRHLGLWLGAFAIDERKRVAYEPCCQSISMRPTELLGSNVSELSEVPMAALRPRRTPLPRFGVAGGLRNKRRFRS